VRALEQQGRFSFQYEEYDKGANLSEYGYFRQIDKHPNPKIPCDGLPQLRGIFCDEETMWQNVQGESPRLSHVQANLEKGEVHISATAEQVAHVLHDALLHFVRQQVVGNK